MGFLIWESAYEDGFCIINVPERIDKIYQLNRGISRAEGWPTDAYSKMNPEYPKDIQLADNLFGAGYVIISKAIRDALEKDSVNNVEFLPIQIINHKGRVASKDYFILNPLDICDCIDIEASRVDWDAKKDIIDYCDQLVLRGELVPENYKIFRLKFWPSLILVHQEIAEALDKAGFTGLSFLDPLKYKGLG